MIGRAGTGKTHHCVTAIRNALIASPLVGPRLILLVPEQASLQMERSLIRDPELRAVHRAEVLSFRRLAFRVLTEQGDGGRSAISPAARSMLLRLVCKRSADALQYYRNTERFPGFLDRLGHTITELIEGSVSPDELQTIGDEAEDGHRRLRFHDLALLYKGYLSELGDRRCDPSQYLDIARERMGGCGWLHGCVVWVDGFAGYTRQEEGVLVELAKLAESVTLSALLDPNDAAHTHGAEVPGDLFGKTRRTMDQLAGRFDEAGVAVGDRVVLSDAPRRFQSGSALALVESRLFAGERRGSGVVSGDELPVAGDGVRLVEAVDRRTEVDYIVSEILELVRRPVNPIRFRDIAIIVRDLEPYHALLSASLSARDIPYFIDLRRSMNHHPLVMLVRCLLEIAMDDYPLATVRDLLKTGLVQPVGDAADLLENVLLASGASGRTIWTGPRWRVSPQGPTQSESSDNELADRIHGLRGAFLQSVDPWVVAATKSVEQRGVEWAGMLRGVLEHLNVERIIKVWADEADGDGDLDLGEMHRQVLGDVDDLLGDIETTLGTELLTLSELGSSIQAALDSLTVGLTPPMLDQVLVGAVERSRHPEIKVAFIPGLNDGLFPGTPAEDPILGDKDRDCLESVGIGLAPDRRQRILDESMLFYVAATRPSERLCVSYARADEMGRELRPSPYLDELKSVLPDLRLSDVDEPLRTRALWNVQTVRDLSGAMGHEFRTRTCESGDDLNLRKIWNPREIWNQVYLLSRGDGLLRAELGEVLGQYVRATPVTLSESTAGRLFVSPLRSSVSALETFAACPFKYFVQHTLRLKPRRYATLDVADIGTIHHAIMEEFIRAVCVQGISLAELSDEDVSQGLGKSLESLVHRKPALSELSAARDRYLLERSLEDLERVARAQREAAGRGGYRPIKVELGFGMDGDDGLEGYEIQTPKGRTGILRGVIDRVDLAEYSDELLGVVVDYKSKAGKRLPLGEVVHGLSLQLLAYLLVLQERGETLAGRPIKPAGALYVSLRRGYTSLSHPSEEPGKKGLSVPRGIVSTQWRGALEEVEDGKGATQYQFGIKKDGSGISNVDNSDAATPEDFERLLEHTRRKMALLIDSIADGEIGVSPYRLGKKSACEWCEFRGVCRFESRISSPRYLDPMKRSRVFAYLAGGGESEG